MDEIFKRTEALLGSSAIEKLNKSHVAVFGVGGVGGYVAEALARSGVGQLTLIDNDTIKESNINRQIIALHSTLGKLKTDAFFSRLKDINPSIIINKINIFYLPENKDLIDFSSFDYVVDAIDTVSGKITIIEKCKENNIPVISSMGTGNKTNPAAFEITDINKTSVCPLARAMRYELRKRGIKNVRVLYSKEKPVKTDASRVPSSVAFVPSVAGLLIASDVIKALIN